MGGPLLLGAGITIATGGLGLGWSVAIGLTSYLAADSATGRYLSGQTLGQSVMGGIGDATPIGKFYAAGTGNDFGTGQDLRLSAGQRWGAFGLASAETALLALGLKGPRAAAAAAESGPIMGGSLSGRFMADATTSFGPGARFIANTATGLQTISFSAAASRFGYVGVRSANPTFAEMMEPAEAARYQAYWARQAAFEDMGAFRAELGGIPARGGKLPDGGTLSRLDTGGSSFYGMSAHGQPTLIGNRFTYTHAEVDALQQAFMAGKLDARAVMYVDNGLCEFCQSGLPRTLSDLQMQELIIHDPVNSWRITPAGTVKIGR